ncbi:hypothetical protein CG747_12535 [Streptomyces sp. CB02959]|uniref:hypothetical protein n=1 Tax=Streptomyces sp. CB02959 TaxID=2020330 RepID=UPI000C27BC62|nr:hypothetical protein [Streptomyces sp. CB02959]PJN40493.1 hypothetical protein CG747_12535 [Streptomyces sp. CB02959]
MTEQCRTAESAHGRQCLDGEGHDGEHDYERTAATESAPAAEAPTLAAIISANVRVLRRRHRWTQAEAGQHWGEITGRPMNAATWSVAERAGGRAWAADDLAVAAALFGLSPAGLLTPIGACEQCGDQPPAGFICSTCGTEAPRKA